MIAYIKGIVAEVTETEVVLDRGGIGISLLCPSGTVAECKAGEEVRLLTYLHVREDAIVLFGFSDERQRELFLQLQNVSGIGCKTAIGILSGVSTFDLAMAIAAGDTKALSGIKGVGKKTAERIIVELKEKVAAVADDGSAAGATRDVQDAILALTALGFSQTEAVRTVMSVPNVSSLSLNEIVSAALRGMR